jgi:predicted enzyme related to lactoylglutathione lyase
MGEVSWHELATTNHEEAFEFYTTLFGWQKTDAMDMGEMGTYQMYGPESDEAVTYGGIFNKPPDMPAPPHWLYYIRVDDIHAAVDRVKENGGQVLNGPMEVPGGDQIAQCLDPQGAAFALHASSHASGE